MYNKSEKTFLNAFFLNFFTQDKAHKFCPNLDCIGYNKISQYAPLGKFLLYIWLRFYSFYLITQRFSTSFLCDNITVIMIHGPHLINSCINDFFPLAKEGIFWQCVLVCKLIQKDMDRYGHFKIYYTNRTVPLL